MERGLRRPGRRRGGAGRLRRGAGGERARGHAPVPDDEAPAALGRRWRETLEKADAGDQRDRELDTPSPLVDLVPLSARRSSSDGSTPNGSSIALLLEHRGASVLLAADAFASVLTKGLTALARHRGVDALAVDAVKVPHHGSRGNVSNDFVRAVPARHYLVSTNGDIFHHPDVRPSPASSRARGATLWFNYRTRGPRAGTTRRCGPSTATTCATRPTRPAAWS